MIRCRKLELAAVAALLLLLSSPAAGQRPVQWRLTAPAGLAPAGGGAVTLRLSARMDQGWYIYSLTQGPGGPTPTSIGLAPGANLRGAIVAPAPERYDDPNFGIETETYHDAVSFRLPAMLEAADHSGAVTALVRFQTCNDRLCLPARTERVTLRLSAAPADAPAIGTAPGRGAAAPAPPVAHPRPSGHEPSVPGAPPAPSAQTAAGAGAGAGAGALLPFLWLAAIMGLLSLLTPCVYPMVPITVGFFSRGNAAPGSARRGGGGGGGAAALAYGAGIVGSFCALGLLVTAAFGAGGVIRLASSPWLNLGVAALFLGFALNLLGAFELRLPAFLAGRIGAAGRGHGVGAALLLGAAFALTTFTCTAPFVGTLLVLATQGSWSWPVLGLLTFASAFALPFLLLALVPDALALLPRSGGWMLTLRRALGILEIAAAAKFLSNADLVLRWNVFTRDVVIGIWVAAGLALALLLLGDPRRWRIPRRAPALVRALALAAALLGAWWMGTGLRGARLGEMEAFLPPPASGALRQDAELGWELNDFQASLGHARAGRRPLLLDFTGYTCTNCRWMEANMFPRPEVRARLEPFVRARLFTDGQGEPFAAQQALEQAMLGTVALPVYAIVAPTGEVVERFVGMTRDSREFNAFLVRGLERARGN